MQSYKKLQRVTHGMFTSLVEDWKDIQGYEGCYQISSFGRVKSLSRYRAGRHGVLVLLKERIMQLKNSKCGYLTIGLHSNAKKFFSVHRLVALHFIPNNENKQTVNHINANKLDNNVGNLEWSTHAEQMQHAVANNLLEIRGKPKYSKAFKQEVQDYFNSSNISISELAKKFEISERTASRCVKEVKPRTTTRIKKDGTHVVEDILTQEQVSEIKKLRSEGWTFSMLSNKFNRGLSQMHRVVNNMSRSTNIE